MAKSRAIKAKSSGKETDYSGVTFRSRLEARWALFFDIVGWYWDYEPCSYRVGTTMMYTPDFFLPDLGLWVEVKGSWWLTARSISKIAASVAGPKRIPLRSPPYGPADRILIAGDLLAQMQRTRPTHNLVFDDGSGKAAVIKCFLGPEGVEPVGKVWHHLDASAVPKTRKPPQKLRDALCLPGRSTGRAPDLFANAYIVASAPFPDTRELKLSSDLAFVVSGRRGGRPVR